MKIRNYRYAIVKKILKNRWHKIIYRFVRPKIIITKATMSGDGMFIDIRYWLSRPDKINIKTSPYLLTSDNKKIGLMYIAKFGVMKSKIRKHTNTGILLFYNKKKDVSIGDKVTLYWDGLQAEGVVKS